jgi:hypothetical protein
MPTKNGPTSIQLPPPNMINHGPTTPHRQNSSASNKISNFFGWKANTASSPIAETSPTTISDRSSITGSPNGTHGTSLSSFQPTKPILAAIDVPRANAPSHGILSNGSFPQAPPTPAYHLDELEEELKDLSEELAASIRREMELEDQLERLQLEGPNALEKDKRTSDYYSDSGTSARDQDPTEREDEERKLKRRSEQEKVQLKVNVSQRVQEERAKRKHLEDHIRNLEAHIQTVSSL